MAATIWSKFFWADWLSDANLQLCSLAAQGFWMRMLCIAAQHDPIGYLCVNGKNLEASDMARIAGIGEKEARSLVAELERNGVCSRGRGDRLYSRRMVRDAKELERSKKTGKQGGMLSRDKQKGFFDPSKGASNGASKEGLAPRVQEPESISQAAEAPRAPLLRACEVMGVELEALRCRPGWMMFGDFFAELVRLGCEPERDIWPTIARVRARGVVPNAPAYFKAAILQARDAHAGGGAVAARASPRETAERMAAFARDGVWSSKWGARPDGGL